MRFVSTKIFKANKAYKSVRISKKECQFENIYAFSKSCDSVLKFYTFYPEKDNQKLSYMYAIFKLHKTSNK